MAKVIKEFQGEYRFLSNFWDAEVEFEGIRYPSSEHAYQAAKTLEITVREHIATVDSPGIAKRLGKKVPLREDWEAKKVSIMKEIVRDKFTRHPRLGKALLETGKAVLQEGNTWGDRFWGMVDGKGSNHLGIILMEIREELRQAKTVKVVSGDLLEAEAEYIIHQTNCVTHGRAAGLAAAIFKKYPWSDIYVDRQAYGRPGWISTHTGSPDEHKVINLNGQFFPGTPRYSIGFDSAEDRQRFFHSALLSLGDLDIKSIAFPYRIGCGLAGGDWDTYFKMIQGFSDWKTLTQVTIYKLE